MVNYGTGFDPGVAEPTGRNGLGNTHRRVAELHGSLRIDSRPGTGTEIFLRRRLASAAAPNPTENS